MATTQLSLTATPGKRYSFIAKTAAGKGSGPFTELSVYGVPGRIHSFAAKTAVSGKGAGPFTELSVIALPGQRHAFLAKTSAVAGRSWNKRYAWMIIDYEKI